MIILSVLLIALLMLGATIVVKCVFKPKWAWLNRIVIAMLALAIVAGAAATIADGVCGSRIADLKAEATNIILYYDTINECDNEYVRFDFYQRVKNYNAEYAACQELNGNIWIGAFLPRGWDSEIGLIDFMLRTGSENGAYNNETFDGDVVG